MNLHSLLKAGAAILAVLLVSACIASGHPHVWVNVETEILTGPNQEITGFRHKWTFDEMYSEFAVNGLDTNGDGIYSEQELQPLAQTNIEALKEFEYFTFAFLEGEAPAQEAGCWIIADTEKKLLTLHFALPLATRSRAKKLTASASRSRSGVYVALTLDKKAPVKIASAKPLPCSTRIGGRPLGKDPNAAQVGENIDPASNLGLQFAERVTIDCK